MKKTNLAALLIGVLLPLICFSQPALQVSDNNRYLVTAEGKPFFWLGDTAWELFHRLDREEADRYLENRKAKGFTVIQAVALAQLGSLEEPNAYGNLPLAGNDPDPTKPVEAYFAHVDYIVKKAASLGLYIGFLPTWGAYWQGWNSQGIFTPQNARIYGEFLGKRYKDQPNIIWILGGDSNPETEEHYEIIEAMAEGLKAGDGGNHLITFHPRGPGRSSDYFHQKEWLDFNMYQSSHAAREFDNGLFAEHDYQLDPPKPTLDGEPRYERIPVGFYYRGNHPFDRFDSYEARTAAYWSLLSGAFGHTYGNNNIWQMYDTDKKPVIGAQTPWHQAIEHPGAYQMGHLKKLFVSRPFELLAPAPKFIVDAPNTAPDKVKAALASDGSFAFIYSPMGSPFTIDLSHLSSPKLKFYWFDPRYGEIFELQESDTTSFKTFTPPTKGLGKDWVLVVEVQGKGFPKLAEGEFHK